MKPDQPVDIYFVPYKRHLQLLFQSLSDESAVAVATSATVASSIPKGVTIDRCRLHSFGLQWLLRWLGRSVLAPTAISGLGAALKQRRPHTIVFFDLYHFYSLQVWWYRWRHPGVRLVCYSETRRLPRGVILRPLFRILLRQLRHVDLVLTYTEDGKDFLQPYAGAVPVRVVPVPVDTDKFRMMETRSYLPEGVLRILINAKYEGLKRHGDLFAAVRSLMKNHPSICVSCISRDGSNEESIRQQAAAAGVADAVQFLPPVATAAEMAEVYAQHDVLVLPSEREAIGMVVPEAMAGGLVTVTSSAVGANVYVLPEETGFIFPVRSVPALAACLERLTDPALVRQLGMAGADHIQAHYQPATVVATLRRGLQQIDTQQHTN